MIGIPTPNVCPSPNFNDTCTGLAGAGGFDDDEVDGAADELLAEAGAPAVLVMMWVVFGPTLSEPQAVATSARTLSAAIRVAAGRSRRARGEEVTQTP